MIRIVTKRAANYHPVRWTEWAAVGVVLGLAALTKEGTLGLFPLAVGTAVVAAWQRWNDERRTTNDEWGSRSGLRSAVGGLLLAFVMIALPALVIAGWWYYRNIVLYGDWLGWNAFIAVLGQRATPASLVQLWGERRGFLMSFWGLFGGVNVPMTMWVYAVLNGFLVLSVLGFVVYLARLVRDEWRVWQAGGEMWFWRLLRAVERHFGLIVIVLFAAAVVYGLVQWATTTWSSQGRLVFTAISPLGVLLALGWVSVTDLRGRRTGVRGRPLRSLLLTAPAVILFLIAAAAPWLWIRPAYIPPAYPGPLAEAVGTTIGDMRLIAYEVEYDELRPGDTVRVRLEWEALRDMDRDWSVFVHLVDPVLGQPIAQRDMFPGQGLLATRLLSPGERLVNDYVLAVPPTAVAPAELQLVAGLYDYATGERPLTSGGSDAMTLTTISLAGGEGPYPNPVSLFFEHGLELVGFAVEPRRVAGGGAVEVVTYWRPGQPLPADFTFFAQIVGADTTRYAAIDAPPPTPTSAWMLGEVYEVRLPLTLDLATPPGLYPLILGLYTRTADGGFDRLQQVTPDGRLVEDFLTLTPVRVE